MNLDNIYIDIGTSIDAPWSAHWLLTADRPFVIMVEPNPQNIEILKRGRTAGAYTHLFSYLRLSDNSILKNDQIIATYNADNILLIEGAIDNVPEKTRMNFYCTDDENTGCSSLLKPTKKLGIGVKQELEIDVYPMKMILDNLDLQRDNTIKFVKTDNQGKDFDVVKSFGEYLNRVEVFHCEVSTGEQYENEQNKLEFDEYMRQNGFYCYPQTAHDHLYINGRFNIDLNKLNLPRIP